MRQRSLDEVLAIVRASPRALSVAEVNRAMHRPRSQSQQTLAWLRELERRGLVLFTGQTRGGLPTLPHTESPIVVATNVIDFQLPKAAVR